jgi:hypothetical protein
VVVVPVALELQVKEIQAALVTAATVAAAVPAAQEHLFQLVIRLTEVQVVLAYHHPILVHQ